jgi:hypothetical protein
MSKRQPKTTVRPPVEWNFVSFPTFFAFMAGLFIATMLITVEVGGYAGILQQVIMIVSLFGVSFSLAHTVTHHVNKRRAERSRGKAEEEERERRALAARAAASAEGAVEDGARHRRRRRRG